MNHDISQLIELVKQIMYDNRFINFLAILVFVLISFAITTSTMTSMNTDEGLTVKSFFEQVEILFWALVWDPTTWTIVQQDGPNHLGLW